MTNSTRIEQICSLIRTCENNDQLKSYFDILVIEINPNDLSSMQEIITTINYRLISIVNLLDHQLFIIIRNCYLNLLFQSQIAHLFYDFSCHMTEFNVESLINFLIDERLINEICKYLNEIASEGKHLHDEHIEGIDYYIRAINHLDKSRIQNEILSKLLDHIVSCICSSYFIEMFNRIDEFKQLNASQTFLLDTCTDFICWQETDQYNRTHLAIRNALLNTFNTFLKNHLLSFENLTSISIKILGQLSIPIIGGHGKDDEIFPPDIRQGYHMMIDQFIFILNSITEMKIINELILKLTRVLTQCLYLLTVTKNLRMYIKKQQIIPLLLNLTNMKDEIIQFHIYRLLTTILTENDIKILANPKQIANVFMKFSLDFIDDSSRKMSFSNLLRSLTILVQHDQIKDELTKQGIIPVLLRCITESKFDSIQIGLPALEILLSLTFNMNAIEQLQKNSNFILDLKQIILLSTEECLRRIAERILWKLENQTTTTNINKKTFDIMLSYSHSDKDLCYRIHDCLVQNEYRVWIDRDEMHGQTMAAMADAIENSEFVILCLSEAYRQSAACQSEAQYAFERQCLIIPLIMKANYRPDGWLETLVSGKVYIDFAKLGFDLAFEKLKRDIHRYRTNRKLSFEQPTIEFYPKLIKNWSTDHIRSFLSKENFQHLLPILGNMNGHQLEETYNKCRVHRDFMFQIFQKESAADGEQSTLSIDTYNRFLDQIENYMPTKSSQICTLL